MVSPSMDAPAAPTIGIAIRSIRPNPSTLSAAIVLSLPESGGTCLEIYDGDGRRVVGVLDAPLPAGKHRLSWNGGNAAGLGLPSGQCLARLQAGGEWETQCLVLLR